MFTLTDRRRMRRTRSLNCLALLWCLTLGEARGQELIYRLQGLADDPEVQFADMWRLVSVPDFDGDGVPDLAIATDKAATIDPACDPNNTAIGGYVLVSGATGGRISPVFYDCLPGGQGTSFDRIGDFNGDGREDLLLGRPRSFTGQGWVDVVDLVTGTVMVTVESPFTANFDVIGNQVRSLGDLDGDGLPEFAAVQDSNALEDGWLVFFSPDGSRMRRHDWLQIDAYGGAILGIGDVDGDGFNDYIGSQPYVDYPTTRGVLNVFSGISGDLIHFIPSPAGTVFSWFGASLENFYDLDQDGLDDVLVMSRGWDSCNTWTSTPLHELARLDVISPATGAVVQTIRLAREGHHPFYVGSCPGFVLDSGGDVNGDGIPDIAESRRTASVGYIYSGATGVALFKHQGIVSSSGGAHAESRIIPDVDGDGFDDWTLGAARDDTGGQGAGSISVFKGAPGDAHTFCPGGMNSTGQAAELYFDGPISISANYLHYVVENGPPGALALAVYGPNIASQPFGAGTLCVGGAAGLYRVAAPAAFDSTGRFVLTIDMTQGPMGSGPGTWMPGDRWIMQVIYRDGPTGNTTNAMDVTFTP